MRRKTRKPEFYDVRIVQDAGTGVYAEKALRQAAKKQAG
jgi:hypothetical protein